MERIKITYIGQPEFSESILDKVLPDNKELRMYPQMGYVPLNDKTQLLSLKTDIEEHNYSLLKIHKTTMEMEYEINIDGVDQLKTSHRTVF